MTRRRFISLTVLSQTSCPHFFGAAKDGRDELSRFVRGRSGRNLLLLRLAAFGQHLFGAANEDAGIDAQCPADQAEYHNSADADAAGTTRSHVSTILNAITSRQLIKAHDSPHTTEQSRLFSDNAVRLLYSRRASTDSKRRPKRTPIALEDRGGRGQRFVDFFFRLSESVTMRFGIIQRRLLVLLAATMRRGGAHGYP